ncbi:hypothetical protein [Acidithrix ferrooxidans]|uniref:hypothetical protein n=1 Tax=Acidithrix ferrooxidans TaxID=1280514 RepID=UPI0013649825|nr:hypothetical protein [Acidithrix ferrooxidans]
MSPTPVDSDYAATMVSLLRWLLDLVGDKEAAKWMQEARDTPFEAASAKLASRNRRTT